MILFRRWRPVKLAMRPISGLAARSEKADACAMFDVAQFIDDCLAAARRDATHRLVHKRVAEAFADPLAILAALGEPTGGQLSPLYRSAELTILNVVWKPGMTLNPHNHRIWAIIGIYQGREDNIFWRRLPGRTDGRIEAAGAKSLLAGDVTALGKDIIHSVTNPIERLTGAIHVYGGDFFAVERSEWDPETLTERPCDIARVRAMFES
jgi:predicted metal-dependent enzyme (double-stranded beta helix superfamily)